MKSKSICAIITALSILFGGVVMAEVESSTSKVFVIGDSTAASYEASRYPLTGWAQVLQMYFQSNITVDNRAQSGASSKSFYNTYWSSIIDSISAGDYLVIQFGHNDSKTTTSEEDNVTIPDPNRYADPTLPSTTEGSYKWYLTKFIEETRAKGATPILTTSIERRSISSSNTFQYTLTNYVNSMKELGVEKNVQVIDLNKKTFEFYCKLGVEGTKDIFLILDPGEYVNYPDGKVDNTHLQENGAIEIAKLFAIELLKSDYDLKQSVIPIEYEEETEPFNLIQNGGFENVTNGVPANWQDLTPSGNPAPNDYNNWDNIAQIVSDGAAEGNNCFRIIATVASQYIQQEIFGLTVGQRYKLSLKFKCTTSTAVPPQVKLQHSGSMDNFDTRVFVNPAKGEWTEYIAYFKAPSTSTKIMVRAASANGHNIFYDDIKLQPDYTFVDFYKSYDKRTTSDQTKSTTNPYQTELLSAEKGVPQNALSAGIVTAKFHYVSESATNENVSLVVGLYEKVATGKKLISLAPIVSGIASAITPLNITTNIEVPTATGDTQYLLEAYLWDSITGLKPYKKSVVLE